MRSLLALAALGSQLCMSSLVSAQPEGSDSDGEVSSTKPTRRSDLTLGVGAGLDVGRARGYPNEIDKIDNRDYKADTRNTLGGGGSVWLGVAFTDWLTFALGASSINLASSDLTGSGTGFMFRLEAFPLFSQGGAFRDLGIFGNFGVGLLKIKAGSDEKADGGTMSLIGAGAFYEAWRLGPIALGPMVEYTHLFSQSAKLDSTLYGARVALYTGPS
jgi:hypothetical protein